MTIPGMAAECFGDGSNNGSWRTNTDGAEQPASPSSCGSVQVSALTSSYWYTDRRDAEPNAKA